MKKLLVIVLAALLAIGFTGCGNGEPGEKPQDNPGPQTDLPTLLSSLSKNEYTDASLGGTAFGLNAPAQVGVDKERFEGEVLYPVPADSQFDNGAVISIQEGAGAAGIADAVAQAKAVNAQGKKVKIKFPAGEYPVDAKEVTQDAALLLDGFDGIYVEGDNTVITIDAGFTKWIGGVTVLNSKNVYIQDIAVDYINSNVFAGTVTNVDQDSHTVSVEADEEYASLLRNITSMDIAAYLEIDKNTLAPRENGNWTQPGDASRSPEGMTVSGNTVTIKFCSTLKLTEAPKGTRAVVYIYTYKHNGVEIENSENVYLEEFSIFTAPGMAMVPKKVVNLYMNNFAICNKPGSQRYYTSTSDGLHYINVRGNVKITNSLFEYNFDDAINFVTGFYMTVSKISPLEDIITLNRYSADNSLPETGDVLEFYDDGLNQKASVTVTEAKQSGNLYICKVKGNYNAISTGMYCANVSASARVEFTNNIIRNKRNRGMLIQVRDAVIANNTFMNIAHGTFNIHSEIVMNYFECIMPRNITIKNNKFINNSYYAPSGGDIQVFVYGRDGNYASADCVTGIEIENNFFTKVQGSAVSLACVSDSSVKNNLFYNCPRVATKDTDCTIRLINCADTVIRGNYNMYDIGSENYSPVKAAGTTNPNLIPLGDNINLAYETVTSDITVKDISQMTSAVKIDGNISDWAATGTDIQLIAAELSNGTSYSGFESYFDVKMLKMGWTDNGIYVAFDVKDDQLKFESASNFWSGDCMEMFLTTEFEIPNADIALQKENGATFQAAFAASSAWKVTTYSGRTSSKIDYKNWEAAVTKTAEGYCGELFIPFSACYDLKNSIEAGEEIAVCFNFIDAPRGNSVNRILYASCNGNSIETNKYNNSKMPRYIFVK